jgi:hypothetical protein
MVIQFRLFLLLFKFLKPSGLLYLHSSVFLMPAVVRYIGNSQLPANLFYRFSFAEQYLGFPQFLDD